MLISRLVNPQTQDATARVPVGLPVAGERGPCDDQNAMDTGRQPYRPLYTQIQETLIRRIVEGEWRPGEALPSEQALALQLGVSQGTIRKAMDALAAEKIIDRRQGKGTFVAELTQERSVYRFFRLSRPDGRRIVPTSGNETVRPATMNTRTALALGMPEGTQAFEIVRTRLVDGQPVAFEHTVVPASVFPGLDRHSPLPNALFTLYQREYGVNVVSTEEHLRADLCSDTDSLHLGITAGSPLLEIERVAVTVTGERVEWRLSRCNTGLCMYGVTLT